MTTSQGLLHKLGRIDLSADATARFSRFAGTTRGYKFIHLERHSDHVRVHLHDHLPHHHLPQHKQQCRHYVGARLSGGVKMSDTLMKADVLRHIWRTSCGNVHNEIKDVSLVSDDGVPETHKLVHGASSIFVNPATMMYIKTLVSQIPWGGLYTIHANSEHMIQFLGEYWFSS